MNDYVTTLEKANEWQISQRRVSILCKNGRIPGVKLVANRWFIPANAIKPEDPRMKKIEDLEAFEDADEIERELLRQGNILINDIEGSKEE